MEKGQVDYMIVFSVLFLLIIGLLMVYSSSYVWAEHAYGDPFYFVKRQLLFSGIGLIGMYVISHIHYDVWRRYSFAMLIGCTLLLILVLIPGVGIVRGGARSWIGIGAFSIQPAEFIKLALIVFLAYYMTEIRKNVTTFFRGFIIPIMLIFIVFGLIMLQPDFGTGVVLVITTVLLVFVAGARFYYFIGLSIIGLIGFAFLIVSAPYRMSRIVAFLDPWKDPLGDGFQIIQSLYAIGPGGFIGVGFKQSLQKYFYLPEPQTDFIFAILGEEFGLIGCLFVLSLFFYLLYRGIRAALYMEDRFARLVAFGIVTMITVQVCMNISVVIGLIPVTGITLPLLSYGGSSLTITLCSLGILLNITRYGKSAVDEG